MAVAVAGGGGSCSVAVDSWPAGAFWRLSPLNGGRRGKTALGKGGGGAIGGRFDGAQHDNLAPDGEACRIVHEECA